jgi:hypothetical protein
MSGSTALTATGRGRRAELEAAAAALIGYSLAGRRSDDQLLLGVQAAWAEREELRRGDGDVAQPWGRQR